MNNTQISEDRHPSKDREIAEQIESILSRHPGIPRESVYLRLRGRTEDAELAAARRSVLVEAMKELLRSGAVVEALVGQQALLYLKGEKPQGAAVYSLHQPALKVWVDPSLKGSYQPTERVVDERTVTPIPKERDDRPVRAVTKAQASSPRIQAVTELLETPEVIEVPLLETPEVIEVEQSQAESIVAESAPPVQTIAPAPQSKLAATPRRRNRSGARDLSAFPAARCTVSANMLASEAAPFFRIMERRETTPSKFLRQMILDFVTQEESQPIAPVVAAPVAIAPAPEVTLEALVADLNRANQRLFEFVVTGSARS